jgi:hypothetical protein
MKMRSFFLICTAIFSSLCSTSQGQVISTVAGRNTGGVLGDGIPATTASLNTPWGVATDALGNIYFSDNGVHVIRKVSTTGIITTIAGNTGVTGSTGDDGPATAALLHFPRHIAADNAGNVYIADQNNNAIRKINTSGIISRFAGTGTLGYTGNGGPATAAEINFPQSVAADRHGNIFIAEQNTIRKIDAAGIIWPVAGNNSLAPDYSGDGGPATAALLHNPAGLCIDTAGNLYIADSRNNVIRKINSSGILSTVAGNNTMGYTGDGSAATLAKLNIPMGVAIDAAGNLYIADQQNHAIRKVNPAGIISTISGNGTSGYAGDGGPAIAGKFFNPSGITITPAGTLFIADAFNKVVRKIQSTNTPPAFTGGNRQSFSVCENDTKDINSLLAVLEPNIGQTVSWRIVVWPVHGTLGGFSPVVTATGGIIMPPNTTFTPAFGTVGTAVDSFTIQASDGTDTVYTTIRVNVLLSPHLAAITGPASVCISTPFTYTNTTPGGVWSLSNGHATISTAGRVRGLTYGVDTISYRVALGSCSATVTKTITILPDTASISGADFSCIDYTNTLIGVPAGGVWSALNGTATVSPDGIVTGVAAGVDTFFYTVNTACGVSTALKTVTVQPLIYPSLVVTASPGDHIMPGETVTFTANIPFASESFVYQWEINGNAIPGATDSVFVCDTIANADSITCYVSNLFECYLPTFSWIYITVENTGIAPTPGFIADIKLLPNPNNGTFNIDGKLPYTASDATIVITDMAGRSIYKETGSIPNGRLKKEISLGADWANGLYLVNVYYSGEHKVLKFVLNR